MQSVMVMLFDANGNENRNILFSKLGIVCPRHVAYGELIYNMSFQMQTRGGVLEGQLFALVAQRCVADS